MAAKVTMVRLIVPNLGWEQEFTCDHAERILSIENNGGWQLPNNSEFEFKDGSISKRNKKSVKGTQK